MEYRFAHSMLGVVSSVKLVGNWMIILRETHKM